MQFVYLFGVKRYECFFKASQPYRNNMLLNAYRRKVGEKVHLHLQDSHWVSEMWNLMLCMIMGQILFCSILSTFVRCFHWMQLDSLLDNRRLFSKHGAFYILQPGFRCEVTQIALCHSVLQVPRAHIPLPVCSGCKSEWSLQDVCSLKQKKPQPKQTQNVFFFLMAIPSITTWNNRVRQK